MASQFSRRSFAVRRPAETPALERPALPGAVVD
ncbi:MAG: hypothetical protein JWR43_2152, partial [Phenylobacterium sp.]|nr:hypothetical protein [Phenylobacterium sp.]